LAFNYVPDTKEAGVKGSLYSIGLSLYTLVAGKNPYVDSKMDTSTWGKGDWFRPNDVDLRKLGKGASPTLIKLVRRMISKSSIRPYDFDEPLEVMSDEYDKLKAA